MIVAIRSLGHKLVGILFLKKTAFTCIQDTAADYRIIKPRNKEIFERLREISHFLLFSKFQLTASLFVQ